MKKYTLTAPLTFRHGVELRLTKGQLESRMPLVQEVGKKGSGIYTPIKEVQFKRGETIEVSELSKSQFSSTEEHAKMLAEEDRRAKEAAEKAKQPKQPKDMTDEELVALLMEAKAEVKPDTKRNELLKLVAELNKE